MNRDATPRLEATEPRADITLDEKRHKVSDARRVVAPEVCFDDSGERVVIDAGRVATLE